MTKQEIIAVFEQAEKDWDRPQRWWQKDRYIKDGLCSYFLCKLDLSLWHIAVDLTPLWIKYRTTEEGVFHFNNRRERQEAIRKVLNDLKQQDESI